jgi:GTP-binding protein HflX
MLSDTVGFVRDLPHNLIASFRATLEEATHADLLLILLDIADPAAQLQYDTVQETLASIFEKVRDREPDFKEPERIVLLNKVDKLRDNREVLIWQGKVPGAIPIVGRDVNHPGHQQLRERVRQATQGFVEELKITIPLSDSRTIHTIENRGEVLDRDYNGTHVTLTARIGRRQLDQLRSMGARMQIAKV